MSDYQSMGYDMFFRRHIPSNPNATSAVGYDSQQEGDQTIEYSIEDGAVTNRKVKNITWDKGKGGSLDLGGARNTDGVLSVKDALRNEKVRMDKDGILINDGSMTIKNSHSTTIMDADGLVSETNFRSNSITASNSTTTTSTSYTDLDSMRLVTPSFSRPTRILILFTTQVSINSNTGADGDWSINLILNVDGSNYDANFINQGGAKSAGDQTGVSFETPTLHAILLLGVGAHTIKIQWSVQNNSGTGKGDSRRRTLSYVVLGQ